MNALAPAGGIRATASGSISASDFVRSMLFAALLLATLMTSATTAALQTATYTGPNDGLWSVPANWSGGVVPSNNITDTFQVIIPTNVAVRFDIAGATDITKLTLNSGATLKPQINSDLNVLDEAGIFGILDADNGNFSAVAANAALLGTSARAAAKNGSQVSIGGTSYSATGINAYTDILSADGAGSALNLSSLQSINDGIDPGYYHTIRASNTGTINLSNVATITGPNNSQLTLVTETGGSINLNGLQTITNAQTDAD
ncbi:MAG: hypothetical protein IT427_00515, partial [Pirellulales bacterium]|nr:hypothetical protein [Pirellulales bacterium]